MIDPPALPPVPPSPLPPMRVIVFTLRGFYASTLDSDPVKWTPVAADELPESERRRMFAHEDGHTYYVSMTTSLFDDTSQISLYRTSDFDVWQFVNISTVERMMPQVAEIVRREIQIAREEGG